MASSALRTRARAARWQREIKRLATLSAQRGGCGLFPSIGFALDPERIMALSRAILVAAILCIAPAALADPIIEGIAEQNVMLGERQMTVFTYRPASCPSPSLLLLFHGN